MGRTNEWRSEFRDLSVILTPCNRKGRACHIIVRMIQAHSHTIQVEDDLSAVGRAQEELTSLWGQYSLPEETENAVSLALEEVLSNVLRHSRTDGRSSEIRVTFTIDDCGFQFEVSDSAAPYNPLLRPDPPVDLPLEQRQAGGLGVFLVRRLADELSYDRRDGRNVLRFRKLFPPEL